MKKTGEIYKWKGKIISLTALSRALEERGYGRGASISNLSKIFSGEYDPRFEMVKELAEIIGVSLDEFAELLEVFRRARAAWEKSMNEAGQADEDEGSRKVSNPGPKVVRETLDHLRRR